MLAGPGYSGLNSGESICVAVGAVSGQTYIDGDVYLANGYEYLLSHLWRSASLLREMPQD